MTPDVRKRIEAAARRDGRAARKRAGLPPGFASESLRRRVAALLTRAKR